MKFVVCYWLAVSITFFIEIIISDSEDKEQALMGKILSQKKGSG